MTPQLEIIITACIVSTACVIPGVFLILRRVALMSDAISHAILMGIVIMFFIVKDLHSPLLMIGAVATGILTVLLTDRLSRMIVLSVLIGIASAVSGYMMALFFSPKQGLLTTYLRSKHQKTDFASKMLLVQLMVHHMEWSDKFLKKKCAI